jgi:hypothetical protein
MAGGCAVGVEFEVVDVSERVVVAVGIMEAWRS